MSGTLIQQVGEEESSGKVELRSIPTLATKERSRGWRTQREAVPDFDGIAWAYRWMEYLSLGTLLERTRWFHLDAGRLNGCRRALVLGDGDGRFTARLMERNGRARVEAVDASAGMLRLLERRCSGFGERLTARHGDARVFEPRDRPDLVVTHFFLDCLTQDEVAALVERIVPSLGVGGLWLVSEFRVPEGWLKWPAWMLVRGLYLAFQLLTGLRVTRLPDYASVLGGSGFELVEEKQLLGGVLVTELWGRVRELASERAKERE
jgi:SAM-dependent methyltransferase